MKAMIVLIGLVVLFCSSLSHAQDKAPSEKAQRQVDNVFRFMHVTIDQPKPIQQPKPKQPTPPAKKETAAPAPVATQKASEPSGASAPLLPKEDPVASVAVESTAVVLDEEQELNAYVKIIPEFPPKLIEKLNGTAVFDVRFYVEPSGAVNGVTIENDKFPLLSPFIIKSVSQWKFLPIKKRQLAAVQIILDTTKEY